MEAARGSLRELVHTVVPHEKGGWVADQPDLVEQDDDEDGQRHPDRSGLVQAVLASEASCLLRDVG